MLLTSLQAQQEQSLLHRPAALPELLAESCQVLRRQERAHHSDPWLPAGVACQPPQRFCCTVAFAKLFSKSLPLGTSLKDVSTPQGFTRPLCIATATPRHERQCWHGCCLLSAPLRTHFSAAKGAALTIFHLQVSPDDTPAGCLQGGDGWRETV